ncbi:MAG: hypothetical protein ACI9A1_001153, partial [Lentimonas sp.]
RIESGSVDSVMGSVSAAQCERVRVGQR